MPESTIEWIIGGLVTIWLAVTGFMANSLLNKIDRDEVLDMLDEKANKDQLLAHETYMAQQLSELRRDVRQVLDILVRRHDQHV